MPSKTRAQDGAGTSCGREPTPNPPLVPPTLAEAIAALVNATAHNTCFLREMAGQQMQQQGGQVLGLCFGAPKVSHEETASTEVVSKRWPKVLFH